MQVIGPEGTVNEHVTVEAHLVVLSAAYRGVHVPANSLLEVGGGVWGGITVAAGGRAVVYGRCNGGITNDGEADVYGTVVGGIYGAGRTRVSPGALIDGVRGRDLDWEATPLTNEAAGDGAAYVTIDDNGGVTVVGAELIETPVIVEGQLQIRGAATAGVRVPADSWLIVTGSVLGGITVDAGGHVALNGTCAGGIANDGEADIFGVVTGGISGKGQTRVGPDAVIDGVKARDLGWEAASPEA